MRTSLARRRVTGYSLLALGAAAFTALLTALIWEELSGREMRSFWLVAGLVGIVLAHGVFAVERRQYSEAVRAGAVPAKWWPPLIAFVITLGIAVIIIVVFGPA